ncbi:MAG: thioredoxin family protein [Bdellovibrionales bacterium]|nr:thioredoxin family protein [Bdellovibrionales bacterium]
MRYLLLLIFSGSFFSTSHAQTPIPFQKFSHSEARLLSLSEDSKITLGFHIRLRPHWHTYWKNPGDSGAPPKFKWKFSPESGLKETSSISWPVPRRIEVAGIVSYAYEGEVLLTQEFKLTDGAVTAELDAEWLVCDDVCIPQTGHFKITVPSSDSAEILTLFRANQDQLPASAISTAPISLENTSQESLTLIVNSPWRYTQFFPDDTTLIQLKKPQVLFEGSQQKIVFTKTQPSQKTLAGVLQLETPEGPKNYDVNLFPESTVFVLMQFLLAAFVGGLILNLMPCVLPIIALKAFSFVKSAHGERKKLRWECIAYTLGILFSFWTLALVIYLFQKSGRGIGWGFQLQSPVFVGALMLLFLMMAFTMLGVFNINILVPTRMQNKMSRNGLSGSFFSGLLAVIVSSPCTAPFMGGAIGFALSQPFSTVFALFTSLGLGLASPYLLLTVAPQFFARALPKPGAWMDTFKKILSLPLFLTAIWLGWIFYQQVSPTKVSAVDGIDWVEFNPAHLKENIGQRNIFVDFTADWCLSCKVNEKLVFSDKKVQEALKKNEILMIKADWTNYNADITAWLKSFNRLGVPFYLFYSKDGSVQILPEVLTPSLVLETINR